MNEQKVSDIIIWKLSANWLITLLFLAKQSVAPIFYPVSLIVQVEWARNQNSKTTFVRTVDQLEPSAIA